jgi:hypothetical protein
MLMSTGLAYPAFPFGASIALYKAFYHNSPSPSTVSNLSARCFPVASLPMVSVFCPRAHSISAVVRRAILPQRLYRIVAGYECANDANCLGHDPLLQIVADRPWERARLPSTLGRRKNAPALRCT